MKGKQMAPRSVGSSKNDSKTMASRFGNSNEFYLGDLQDENLDFEPEEEEDNSQYSSIRHETFENVKNISRKSILITNCGTTDELESTSSTLHIGEYSKNSVNENTPKMNSIDLDGISTVSHRSEMIPYYKNLDMSEDGRKNEYLKYVPYSSDVPCLIDSSSSSGFSGGNTNQDEMDEGQDDRSSQAEYDLGSDEENHLLESDKEFDTINSEVDQNTEDINNSDAVDNIPVSEGLSPKPIFAGNKVETTEKNIVITVTKERPIKWIRYHPYPQTRLFLEDLGYVPPSRRISESKSSSGSETNSVHSSRISNFKVTIHSSKPNEKRICEVDQCIPQMSGFKMPQLPPVKRPPSRRKKGDSSSSAGSTDNKSEKQKARISAPKEDDTLSIAASSISQFDRDYQDIVKEKTVSLNDYQESGSGYQHSNYSKDSFVENWVSSQEFSKPTAPSIVEDVERKARLSASHDGPRINFNDVPKFFNSLCYRYFLYEKCNKFSCKNPHYVNEQPFLKKCKEMNPDEMIASYNFTLRFHKLFQEIYPVLIKCFGILKMDNKLIASIDDFFSLKDKVNFNEVIKLIVAGLEDTGLTFTEAVEKISFNIGFMRYPILAEILLDLLTQKENLAENWEVIRRICRATNSISPVFVERILSRILLTTPINRDLCVDIYNVIIKSAITNLSKVDEKLLTPIKTFVEFGGEKVLAECIDKNLAKERTRFENNEFIPNHDLSRMIVNEDTVTDSDERLHFVFPTASEQAKLQEDVLHSPTSSRSSRSAISGEFNTSGSSSNYPFSKNYNYVPHSITLTSSGNPGGPSQIKVTFPNRPTPPFDAIQTLPPVFDASKPPPPLLNASRPTPVLPTNTTNNSSSRTEIDLFPEMPIIGKFGFQRGYVFNSSLHHLLLCSTEQQVAMDEQDIIALNEYIRNGDGGGFLDLLFKYEGPPTLQSFITMSIASINHYRQSCNTFMDLLKNIESIKFGFKRVPVIKGVLEVIAFNLLLTFEKKCLWQEAKKVIETFSDWDSLVTSKQFNPVRNITHMGRYILLAKLLAHSDSYYYVYEILQCPELNLVHSPDKWPLFRRDDMDLDMRNSVLTDFFKFAYQHNVEVVCDMYRRIYQFGNIYQFDAYAFFNPMLENLINSEKTSSLKHFFNNIDMFYKMMDRNILRAFIVYMTNILPWESKFKLYEIGCRKGVYTPLSGQESTIIVRTNMPDNELTFILKYYFYKLSKLHRYEINHDLQIQIKLPDGIVSSPHILAKCLRSIVQVNTSLKNILSKCFGGIGIHYAEQENSTMLVIPVDDLRNLVTY